MAEKDDSLKTAFLEDHRQMTRGFARLRRTLESGDWSETVRLAEELDRRVGPHMEFEETVYYPMLEPVLGKQTIARFYTEHRVGLAVLEEILASGAELPDEDERAALIERTNLMLGHAATCGTLLSHLNTFPKAEQDKLLEHLRAIRARKRRWTEWKDAG